MALHPTLLKTLNLVTYLLVVATGVFYREFLQDIYASRPNYLANNELGFIVPATVWALLGGFVIVQWFDFAHDVVVEAIDWHLFASNLVVIFWVFSWKFDWLVVSEVLLVINAILIWRLYIKMRDFTATNIADYAFVHISFSIYTGLVWFDVLQNFFTAFTDKEGGPTSWTALGAAAAIFVMLAIGNYHAEFSKDPDSWAAISIALFEQGPSVPIIYLVSFISFGCLLGALIRRLVNHIILWRSPVWRDDEIPTYNNGERSPLIRQ
ncbi:hypothetical protein BX616_000879 [Lobosporangium transversale]|nr:hypothetical protein BX616_000879 [Lobosporangium transversale]